ncbi:unnamed protein product [Phytophthora fragariaefolia]|uniref:Unnamed protein product n=1 Tax=Phytophthora fragariaefolia TaxID=1490495 RepID=A0A9W6XTW7_9STRA|nr:unnamed protein product [Phytophthora fragariaefolia]
MEFSDRNGRGNLNVFNVGDLVLLATRNLPLDTVSSVRSSKRKHRFIGPFAVLGTHGNAYVIDLPKSMKTSPMFYMCRLKRYHFPQWQSAPDGPSQGQEKVIESLQNETESQKSLGVPRKPTQARGTRVGSPTGRMTKLRVVGTPQQGLHKPGGPSVAHHTRESRTTESSPSAGSHGAPAAKIGGGKHPGEVSTLCQRSLGGNTVMEITVLMAEAMGLCTETVQITRSGFTKFARPSNPAFDGSRKGLDGRDRRACNEQGHKCRRKPRWCPEGGDLMPFRTMGILNPR